MTSILDKTGIDVSEKVRLYNQALLRYNDMCLNVLDDNGYYGRGRGDNSKSATREGASAGVAFKDTT